MEGVHAAQFVIIGVLGTILLIAAGLFSLLPAA
jgi:hypothetical protein